MTPLPGDRRGIALPAVILLVALLTALLTTGLSRARTERQIAEASDETAGALTIAQSGLQTYLGTVTTRPADGDSTRINVTGGYANVVTYLVRQPADTIQRTLYLVRSTGVVITPDSGAAPRAQRTVAQFAEWEAGYMLHRAALTAPNGLQQRNGSSILYFSGYDACATNAPIPAARTTSMTTVPPAPAPTFLPPPGLIAEGVGTGLTVATQTAINWAGALGGELVPDYTSFQNGNFAFPVQRVAGNLALAGTLAGTGLLVVGGDLDIGGSSFDFRGVILVGGSIDFNASLQIVRGLVISGLNEQLGVNPQRTEMGGTNKNLYIYYDSCFILAALAPLTGLTPIRNAWLDTWASY
ncbi:MAG: hypothetical protein OEY20_06910 [Gemmatimonadota bacterium]|nr:hypothetical protein [Gemmatimonadota bacterium]MDH5196965.1 hypothetical protein [Gemmatimonadota bacterium]